MCLHDRVFARPCVCTTVLCLGAWTASQSWVKVPIAAPQVGPEEIAAVVEVLRSGQLVQDTRVRLFEEGFARLHDCAHAVATSNGTTALTASLLAHGIGPGDEVIMPALTFFATASSVLGVGAVPVLAEIRPDTFTIDVEDARARVTGKTRAILPVHLFGHPADMRALQQLCQEKALVLLEDAAQAHLASVGGQKVGTFGTGSFSFYASKNLTTGEGGMVLTQSDAVATRLRMIRNQGRNERGEHVVLGGNFRMTELCAALGCVQLDKLSYRTAQRQRHADYYNRRIAAEPRLQGLRTPWVAPDCNHSFHQYTLLVERGCDRNHIVQGLRESGVDARVYYPRCLFEEPALQRWGGGPCDFPIALDVSRRVFSIPVHPGLEEAELELAVQILALVVSAARAR